MAANFEHSLHSQAPLDAALAAWEANLSRTAIEQQDERRWAHERNTLAALFDSAAEFTRPHTLPYEVFAEEWGQPWWAVIEALRAAGIRSLSRIEFPEGLGYVVARQTLDRGLGEGGSIEGVVADLGRALATMLPRYNKPAAGTVRDEDAPWDWMFNQPHDRLPSGDRVIALRDFFYVLKRQILEIVDKKWADRVPAARSAPAPLQARPSATGSGLDRSAKSTATPESKPTPQVRRRVPPGAQRALDQFNLAAEVLPGPPTDRDAYDHLHRRLEMKGFLSTGFEAWQRQLRTARRALGVNKNSSRRGRAVTSAVVREGET